MFKHVLGSLGVIFLLSYSASASVVLNFFPVSDYNANTATMNATLGVSGYTIDDFETTSFISGLTVTLSGGGVPTTTLTSLANLIDESVCGSLSADSVWDGTHGMVNTVNNALNSCTTPTGLAQFTTFNYAPGTASFGVGFGNFQSLSFSSIPITNHELFVNGQDMGTLEALAGANWTPGLARNGYLRIDGTGGTLITSVAIENLTAPDVLVFDHVAVEGPVGVPEPSVFLMLLPLGLIFLKKTIRQGSYTINRTL